jgi:hypothetical protein
MHIYLYIFIFLFILLLIGYIFLYIISYKIHIFEKKLLQTFVTRTDVFPALNEITKEHMSRHNEIFAEAMQLRKKEFSLIWVSQSLEWFLEVEWHIHHEINFIFQVCNKNPKLLKEKRFLYIRDIMIDKSSNIAHEMKKYRKIIEIYNKIIKYKNYSVIWLILPFTKKPVL